MRPVTIDDFEAVARERLSPMAYDYYRSGADEEHTLHRNREAWTEYALHYRVLVDVSAPSTATRVLGTDLATPILIAPTAYHKLAHPDGERATTRAAAAAGTLYVASTLATTSLEHVAAAAPGAPKWFQLYVHKDREFTLRLIARAKAAGYGAVVVTCDTPVLGRRCADVRNGFALPDGLLMENLVEVIPLDLQGDDGSELARYVASRHDAAFSWSDLRDLADACAPLPLVVKGIARGDDARRALDHGARAIWVSNHGGRQLDLAPSTADALVEVVDAVGRAGAGGDAGTEVYVDGGIRSGTHALVALGLGATAVFVGRPILWGLAEGGEAGVKRVLELLNAELVRAMQLAGCPDLASARDDLVRRHRRATR
jgi:4-hydroxymandelate oxidase